MEQFESKSVVYDSFVNTWLEDVKGSLDSITGLIPHEVDFETQTVLEGAKGSSQSLMLNFLIEIDSTFAKAQFEKYRTQFLDYRFGLPGIREYPKGTKSGADIDSGSVLLGIGGSASLVGQRTIVIVWANVVLIQNAEKQVGNWRWAFQLLSLTILCLIYFLYKKKGTRIFLLKPKNKSVRYLYNNEQI